MNKLELIGEVVQKTPHAKSVAADVVDAVFEVLTEAMQAQRKVSIPNFGIFEVVHTAPRKARNPQTGAEVVVPAGVKARFKPGKSLKDALTATPAPRAR